MIGKCCVAAVLLFAATAAARTSTTLDVPIVVTHGALSSCANGPTISVDNPAPAAGSTINVTVACGPGNQKDYVQLTIYPNKEYVGPFVYLNGATNGTFQLPIPQVVQDRPASYVAVFNVNNTFNELAETTPMVVPPTIFPPAPTSTLPSALAADPFVPDHTFTVCASGCNYTNLGAATDAASSLDNVLIKVSSGDYPFPQNYLGSSYPPHLWIKGVGATMPHFYGITNNGASIIGTHQAACASNATFTMDNLELGPWNYWTVKSTDCITFTMRNSYIHDTPQGMITGNTQHLTLNLYNDVFARHGSGNGPEHDIYVGEGDQTNIVNVKNSVFEQSFIGHAFKERAKTLNATCSMFIVNQDAVYLGSETLDAAYAGQINANYDLFATGDADQAWSSSDAWDTTRYGYEAGPAPFSYPNNSTPIFSNSIFLDDDPVTNHDFVSIAVPITPSAPVTWSGNKFVWASPQAYVPTDGGAVWFNNTSRWAHPGDIVLDNTNQIFTSRAAAGLPAVGTYPKGWRDFLPMMPAACTDPIGNVKIPTN